MMGDGTSSSYLASARQWTPSPTVQQSLRLDLSNNHYPMAIDYEMKELMDKLPSGEAMSRAFTLVIHIKFHMNENTYLTVYWNIDGEVYWRLVLQHLSQYKPLVANTAPAI